MCSAIFTKRNNFCDFLLASLEDETFPKRVQLLKAFAEGQHDLY